MSHAPYSRDRIARDQEAAARNADRAILIAIDMGRPNPEVVFNPLARFADAARPEVDVWHTYEVVSEDGDGIAFSINTCDRDAYQHAAYWARRRDYRIVKVRYEQPRVHATRTIIEDPATAR